MSMLSSYESLPIQLAELTATLEANTSPLPEYPSVHSLVAENNVYLPALRELETEGTEIIEMNQSGQVTAEPGERRRIATFDLTGCTAIGVVATFPGGERRAHMQHCDPFQKRMYWSDRSPEEGILIREAEQGQYAAAEQVDAVIMVPGRSLTEQTPYDSAHAAWLTETIKKSFGESTNVTVVPYPAQVAGWVNPYKNTLVIDVPEQGMPDIFPGLADIS
jgi:hypothetical protein